MKVKYNKTFVKQYERADKKIRKAFHERLDLFLQDPLHSRLHNHQLSGNFKSYKSINITGDWRALYSEVKGENNEIIVIFEMIRTSAR